MTEAPYNDFGDTVDLIRSVGVWKLGFDGGCWCTRFEVQGVHVEVSCHKSASEIRVASTVGEDWGPNAAMLRAVASEVVRQLRENTSDEYVARFTVRADGGETS